MGIYQLDGVSPNLPDRGRYWIAPTATLIGKIRLHEDASVWWGAVARGDNEWITIGRGSNVQDLCMLHTDMGFPMDIGVNCTIGHSAILHGCTIGDNSLVGMGATILNGARIGKNSVVGANALVTEGKSFPDNSLIVGSPARALKTLNAEAAAAFGAAAAHYVENWRRYEAGLTEMVDRS